MNLRNRFRLAGLRLRFFVLILSTFSLAQDDEDYELDRCTRWHHQSMLRGDSIFLDGGVQLNRNSNTTWLGFSKYIFEIDMSRPWNVSTNYTEKRIGRFGDTLMGANPPNMVRGALYRGPGNDSRVFTFAGTTFVANDSDADWEAPSSNQYSLWTFDTSYLTWNQYDISAAVPQRPNWGLVAEDINDGVGFWLNGEVDRGSSNVLYSTTEYVAGQVSNATDSGITYLDGMIIIDMPTQKARNVSTDTLGAPRIAGGMVHSPAFGKTSSGALITFGGMRSASPDNNTFTNGALIDFDTVSLCDSLNEDNPTWVNQTTTGDIPPPRIDFCTLPQTKQAKDKSSIIYHIAGGYDPLQNIMYDDVYALAVPSFTWTKLYNGSDPRFGHTCHSAGNRQFARFGGSLNASMYAVETTGQLPNLTTLKCDADSGVSLFDMTNLTWSGYFDYYAPAYQVPQKIVDVIGGTPDGGATMTQPENGFANDAVYTMFHPPPANSTATPTPKPEHHTAAIAGGVVGGVGGVALIIGFLWFLHRKRAAKRAAKPPTSADGPAARELGSEGYHEAMSIERKPTVEMPGDDGAKELPRETSTQRQEKLYELPAEVPRPGEAKNNPRP